MTDDDHRPRVLLSNRQDLPVDEPALTDLAVSTLLAEDIAHAELSVSFVTEDEMAGLHERYLDEPGATDVLSFPQEGDEPEGPRILGDVVICPAFASRQNTDVEGELRLLIVHGILHLLGYDHEEDGERAEMWARQERYSGVRA